MKTARASIRPASIERRSFLKAAALAGLAIPASLAGWPTPAGASNWRGLVGCVKPTTSSDSLEDIIKLLPKGVGVLPVYMNFTKGTKEEMQTSFGTYERNVAYLAEQHCTLISIEGAPPFMVLGREAETRLIDEWQAKYNVPMFTAPQNQVAGLNALKAKSLFGATPFHGEINNDYATYFRKVGFDVVGMAGMEVPFGKIPDLAPEQIYAFIKAEFLRTKGADVIYILGSAWDTLGIVEPLEQDLGIPVLHPIAARIWEIQRRLRIRQPIKGYGHLLETLPA
jgi:maleate isomerase